MDAAHELAQLSDRLLRFVLCALDERDDLGIAPGRPLTCEAEVHGGDDQSRLHAVVEVTLDARALCLGDVEGRSLADLELCHSALQLRIAVGAEQPADEAAIHDGETVDDPRCRDEEEQPAEERPDDDAELGPPVDVGRTRPALDEAPDRSRDPARARSTRT